MRIFSRHRALVVGLVTAALLCACASGGASLLSAPLEKTRWALVSLGPDAVTIAKTQSEPFLIFGTEPGRVAGSSGCNRLAGGYEQTGEKLAFTPLAGTRMACADGMEVESAFHQALAKVASFAIRGDALELRDAQGALLATLEASSGTPQSGF